MRVFLYEFITGGGLLESPGPLEGSLFREGQAMLRALAADFAALEDVRLRVLQDRRVDFELPGCEVFEASSAAEERERFRQLAAEADWTVVIAPEIGGALLERCRLVQAVGGRLLGPDPELVQLAADKHRLAIHLAARRVPVPPGLAVAPGEPLPRDFAYPAVLKPRDGAGSQGVCLLDRYDSCRVVREPSRLERFCPGMAASVAVLCGPGGVMVLEPCRQHLSDDGHFTYQGGSLPLSSALAQRARSLAEQTLAALPPPCGYLGIDLVLGSDFQGRDDYVIEVNSRLTTSYVGLRAATADNLAAAMLRIAQGQPAAVRFSDRSIQFSADGKVTH